jgi:PEP-CTERM motif-containing protein
MRRKLAFAASVVFAAAAHSPAQAAMQVFTMSGSGISSTFTLTYEPNPNTGVLPRTSPNPVDPVGSYIITGIAGTFSDLNIGLVDALITGIVPSNPSNPQPTNLLAPQSFGFYSIDGGRPTPAGGVAPGFSYDNLFYPGGAPQTASDYPFGGGLFDIYGIVFTLAGGDAVNVWSNGNVPRAGLSYGVGVTDGTSVLDYQSPVSLAAVPEPATWVMMLVGFGVVGWQLRRRSRANALLAQAA